MRNVEGCVFCDIINGQKQGYLICEDKCVTALLSLEGHPLIIPRPHFSNVFELDEIHAAAIMKTAVRVAKATKAAMGCDGLNLIQSNGASAGQDVFHFHLHIKPRFIGDDVTLQWNTNAMSEAIREDMAYAISTQIKKDL